MAAWGLGVGTRGDSTDLRKRDHWSSEAIVDHLGRLHREIAELRIEAARLLLPSRGDWSILEALNATEAARQELAQLQGYVARLRLAGGDLPSATSAHAGAPAGVDHGRTLFATLCAGTSFFDAFCAPFLASFERAYGAHAVKHRLLVFVTDVPEWMVQLAAARFGPWCWFERLGPVSASVYGEDAPNSGTFLCGVEGDGQVHCEVDNELTRQRKTKVDFRDTLLQSGIIQHLEQHDGRFCYAVFIDSDTLFVRPIGDFLPPCGLEEHSFSRDEATQQPANGVDWDVAITAYDEHFVVPWSGDTASVARTRGGLIRINGGVVLVSLRRVELAKRFLRTWANVAVWLDTGGEEPLAGVEWSLDERARWRHWRDGINAEFRGPSQASLVLLLCSFETAQLPELLGWGSCRACAETVEAQIQLRWDEPVLPVRFRAFPARQLNHPESMPNLGAFAPELRIVHLKGFWWRQVLDNHALFLVDEFRRTDWNRDALMLHYQLYETWAQELPVERRARKDARGIFFGPDGQPISMQEMQEFLAARRESRGQPQHHGGA